MRKKARQRYTVYLISRAALDHHQAAAVLDMLRYDGSRVLNNAPRDYWAFMTSGRPDLDRWKSFAIEVDYVSPACGFTTDAIADAERWARARITEGGRS